ncbi:hypothetical protein LCGC14_1562360 [marine sediment metagenome]|uniref:Uncharacterized protein n=1 Tax=marine sediment metagenome TaxID=412755 RepID=A0A0F9LMU4_9ZZZZ
MADQGRWFKLWITANTDPDLENLTLENFGRWCRFGAFLKAHGTRGTIKIKPPGKALCNLFRVQTFDEVLVIFRLFPNTEMRYGKDTVTVEVSWRNWLKYQEDTTVARRMKRHRALRSKKRGEEKRGEERRINTLSSPPSGDAVTVFEFWKWCMEKSDRTQFTEERKKKVRDRLKVYSLRDVVRAICGNAACPHNQGHNERDTKFDDLELICRNSTKLEYFWQFAGEEEKVAETWRRFENETGKGPDGQGDTSAVVHSGTGGGDEKGGN